jgi:hypothetical protein
VISGNDGTLTEFIPAKVTPTLLFGFESELRLMPPVMDPEIFTSHAEFVTAMQVVPQLQLHSEMREGADLIVTSKDADPTGEFYPLYAQKQQAPDCPLSLEEIEERVQNLATATNYTTLTGLLNLSRACLVPIYVKDAVTEFLLETAGVNVSSLVDDIGFPLDNGTQPCRCVGPPGGKKICRAKSSPSVKACVGLSRKHVGCDPTFGEWWENPDPMIGWKYRCGIAGTVRGNATHRRRHSLISDNADQVPVCVKKGYWRQPCRVLYADFGFPVGAGNGGCSTPCEAECASDVLTGITTTVCTDCQRAHNPKNVSRSKCSPAVPFQAVSTAAFTDLDVQKGYIRGDVVVPAAANETGYALFWSDDPTIPKVRLSGSTAADIATMHGRIAFFDRTCEGVGCTTTYPLNTEAVKGDYLVVYTVFPEQIAPFDGTALASVMPLGYALRSSNIDLDMTALVFLSVRDSTEESAAQFGKPYELRGSTSAGPRIRTLSRHSTSSRT